MCRSAADGHFSRTPIARRLQQPTRESIAGRTSPRRTAGGPPAPCLALLRVGFTKPAESPRLLVSSYLTVSPLPRSDHCRIARWRFAFCGTFPGLAAGRRYRPPCPAEPGLSSRPPDGWTSDRLVPSRSSGSTIPQTDRGEPVWSTWKYRAGGRRGLGLSITWLQLREARSRYRPIRSSLHASEIGSSSIANPRSPINPVYRLPPCMAQVALLASVGHRGLPARYVLAPTWMEWHDFFLLSPVSSSNARRSCLTAGVPGLILERRTILDMV